MIILNNTKFVKNNSKLVDTLFQEGGTAKGYYKAFKAKVELFDLQNNLIGVITKHKVLARASKMKDKNAYWYDYGTIPLIGEYKSYLKSCEEIEKALKTCCVSC